MINFTSFYLKNRILNQGTLSNPEQGSNPDFALKAFVNWIRALRLLVEDEHIEFQNMVQKYRTTQKCNLNDPEVNTVLEHLLLSLHQLSSLKSFQTCDNQSDVARMASVAWYYGIYDAGTAMVAAQSRSLQNTHTDTAREWHNQLIERDNVVYPFDLKLSSLEQKLAELELRNYSYDKTSRLIDRPTNIKEANECACAYLSGSRDWWAKRVEQRIKDKNSEFKKLEVSDFRTKKAREIRDKALSRWGISFLHLAYRFRGKANYRDALFLAYGIATEFYLDEFVSDLTIVLEAFLIMSGAFCSRRLGDDFWQKFIEDVHFFKSFSLSPRDIWA